MSPVFEVMVMVSVDTAQVRQDAERLADAGHHGSAHLLYKALEALQDPSTPRAVRTALGWPDEAEGSGR